MALVKQLEDRKMLKMEKFNKIHSEIFEHSKEFVKLVSGDSNLKKEEMMKLTRFLEYVKKFHINFWNTND